MQQHLGLLCRSHPRRIEMQMHRAAFVLPRGHSGTRHVLNLVTVGDRHTRIHPVAKFSAQDQRGELLHLLRSDLEQALNRRRTQHPRRTQIIRQRHTSGQTEAPGAHHPFWQSLASVIRQPRLPRGGPHLDLDIGIVQE